MPKPLFFEISMLSYILSGILYLIDLVAQKKFLKEIAFVLQVVGLACGALNFALIWAYSGYPPLRNLFESLMLMAHLVIAWHLVQSAFRPLRVLGPASGLCAGLLMAWASAFGGGASEHTLPALQHSFWLTSHVFFSMLSYAAVLLASIAALFHIMGRPGGNRAAATSTLCLLFSAGISALVLKILSANGIWVIANPSDFGLTVIGTAFVLASLLFPAVYSSLHRFGVYAAMEHDTKLIGFTHRTAVIALAMMSLAIITGSVWGDVAWGRYWGWDPKEVWALITWFSLLGYLHARFAGRRWRRFAPWIIIIGLITVLFNYFGVNFILAGLHSYAG